VRWGRSCCRARFLGRLNCVFYCDCGEGGDLPPWGLQLTLITWPVGPIISSQSLHSSCQQLCGLQQVPSPESAHTHTGDSTCCQVSLGLCLFALIAFVDSRAEAPFGSSHTTKQRSVVIARCHYFHLSRTRRILRLPICRQEFCRRR
jgi:hypothetical protein